MGFAKERNENAARFLAGSASFGCSPRVPQLSMRSQISWEKGRGFLQPSGSEEIS